MCCSMANVYPELRTIQKINESLAAGKPLYYVNAFTQPLFPVITAEDPDKVQYFHWGLIPPFCRSQSTADSLVRHTVNARCEAVFTKPSFKQSALLRRCLVPVTGFFEWHDQNGKKYPYYITMKDKKDFALAGIWNRWTNPETGKTVSTFSILTTEANPQLAVIHNLKKRMPVILTPAGENLWLNTKATPTELEPLFKPYSGPLDAWSVQKIPMKPGIDNNRPEIQEPFSWPELEKFQEEDVIPE